MSKRGMSSRGKMDKLVYRPCLVKIRTGRRRKLLRQRREIECTRDQCAMGGEIVGVKGERSGERLSVQAFEKQRGWVFKE